MAQSSAPSSASPSSHVFGKMTLCPGDQESAGKKVRLQGIEEEDKAKCQVKVRWADMEDYDSEVEVESGASPQEEDRKRYTVHGMDIGDEIDQGFNGTTEEIHKNTEFDPGSFGRPETRN